MIRNIIEEGIVYRDAQSFKTKFKKRNLTLILESLWNKPNKKEIFFIELKVFKNYISKSFSSKYYLRKTKLKKILYISRLIGILILIGSHLYH